VVCPTIIRAFETAAPRYDSFASVQAHVAKTLVEYIDDGHVTTPQTILDIGCGTGLLCSEAAKRWPHATITALDAAPAMLQEAKRKNPNLITLHDDAASFTTTERFDLILSSMALHWLPRPETVLRHWQSLLQPTGSLYVALPIEGSLSEWRTCCAEHGVKDGLWDFPPADFANDSAHSITLKKITASYPSAHAFLCEMKNSGAATAHPHHRAIPTPTMRALLTNSPKPFEVSYDVLFCRVYVGGRK
jgi:malonyl-CoA O-methyltransferase